MDFLTAAMEVLPLGWKVFPLSAGQKIPALSKARGGRGVLDATDDDEIIEAWAHQLPYANLGLACGEPSGIIVVDIDPRNGGNDAVKKLRNENCVFPGTVCSRTANGGWHLFYKFQAGPQNSASKLGTGIDIKTTGGYVVAPPSELIGGKRYVWHRKPLGADLPSLPRWAVERLKPKERTPFYHEPVGDPGDLTPLVKYLEYAPEGQRNKILHWCACRAGEAIKRGEVGVQEAFAQLASAASQVGLDKGETEATIRSGFRGGSRNA